MSDGRNMGNDKWMIPVVIIICLSLCSLMAWLMSTEGGCSSFVVIPLVLVLTTILK